MGIKFVCGHCGELIHESNSTFAFPGWQQCEKCGHETYFDKFVVREKEEKQPGPIEVRRFRDETPEELAERIKRQGLPSGADLDAVAEEEKLKAAAAAPVKTTDGQELLADFENHKTDAVDDEARDAKKAVEEHLNPPKAQGE